MSRQHRKNIDFYGMPKGEYDPPQRVIYLISFHSIVFFGNNFN